MYIQRRICLIYAVLTVKYLTMTKDALTTTKTPVRPDEKTRADERPTAINRTISNVKPRRIYPSARGASLLNDTINLFWPWRYHEYRGWRACASEAFSQKANTLADYMCRGNVGVPSTLADTIIAYLDAKIAHMLDLKTRWILYRDEQRHLEQTRSRFLPGRAKKIADLQPRAIPDHLK